VGACSGPDHDRSRQHHRRQPVVTRDVPPYSLVGGIPGKVLRPLEEASA
jgi:hypothetical protein